MNVQRLFAVYRISFFPILASLFLAMVCFAESQLLHAQSGSSEQWKVFPVSTPVDSFRSRFTPTTIPFFVDSLHGYSVWRRSNHLDTAGNGVYTTDDGGKTWTRAYRQIPIPFELKGAFGLSPEGLMTKDGGQTWNPFLVDNKYRLSTLIYGTLTEEGFPKVMAGFLGSRPRRLVFTIDGGETWIYADTVKSIDDWQLPGHLISVLNDTTLFGVMPIDPITGQFEWESLLGITGDTLYLTSRVISSLNTLRVVDHFRAFNLVTHGTREHLMDSLSSDPLTNLHRTPQGILYGWNPFSSVNNIFVRSTNEGRTWDSATGIPGSDFSGFRFLSPTYGISANAFTTDGGISWHRWGNPWQVTSFFPLDSLHLFAFSDRMMIRSDDAGRSWLRPNDFWAMAGTDAVYAWNRTMLVGAGTRELLVGSDSAESWTNLLDVPGALPEEFSQVQAFAVPDTANAPNRVIALASCARFDSGAPYASLLESEDGGLHWQNGGRLPILDALVNKTVTWSLRFVPNNSGGGTTGFLHVGVDNEKTLYKTTDGGHSWQFLTEEPLNSVSMADDQYGVGGREGALLRTSDGGQTWTIAKKFTAPLRFVFGLNAFDRDRFACIVPNDLQIPYEWKPVHSSDGGATWNFLRGQFYQINMPERFFWLSPSEVYNFSELGILYSSDSGRRFTVIGNGLPIYIPERLTSDGHYLYQFDSDSARVGRWRIQDKASGVEESDESIADAGRVRITLLEAPVRAVLRFRYAIRGAGSVTGGLYDTWGRNVLSIPEEHVSGEGIKEVNVSDLPSGFYFIRLAMDGKETLCPVQIVR